MTDNTGNGDADNDAKQKVAFSLGNKRKSQKTVVAPVPEFGEEEREKRKNERRRKSPLVIPLPDSSSQRGGYLTGRLASSTKPDDEKKEQEKQDSTISKKNDTFHNDEDAAAAEALMQSATDHFSNKQKDTGASTNFSAQGSLVISGAENTAHQQQSEAEAQQLRRDLESRPDDLPVDSEVYEKTPISEFGAAMLRGMGWTGNDNANKTGEDSEAVPRPHRLGLGATPKLPTSNTIPGKMRRPDQVARDERLLKQHQEYESERQKRLEKDKQRILQDGSIVELADGKRAKMVKLMGVPGLNRVMVLCEGETEPVTVKRRDVMGLVDRQELEEKPFREVAVAQSSSKSRRDEDNRPRDEKNSERRRKEEVRRSEDNIDSERRRTRDKERSRDSDKDRDRHRDDGRDRQKKRRSEDYSRDHKKRRRQEEPEHWLLTNIRVRMVTEKLGRRHYKQKGVVLDVTDGGGKATLQMTEGQVLDRVPERYLETALPKIGGNAIVLVGKHKFAKGKLLERDSKAGTGVIQVFEDMNVLTLSLDDVAEWCGPLDDTVG